MSQRKNRLARKAQRVTRSGAEKSFREELGAVLRKRDAALTEANKMYEEDTKSAREMMSKRKKEAWDGYKEARDALVKKYAVQEINERMTDVASN